MPTVRRAGIIHEFDPDSLPADLPFAGPIPVTIRDLREPGALPAGELSSAWIEDGRLWGAVDWAAEIEQRAGDSTPSALCQFDDAGRLTGLTIELGDPDDDDSDDVTDPRAGRDGDSRATPLSPTERQAEMAANGSTDDKDKNAPNRDQAVTADRGTDGASDNRSPEDLARENARLLAQIKETNRKAMADRLRLEELDRAEQERKDANLGETEKQAKARQEAERRAVEAERRAVEAERKNDELRLERLVEAEARKVKLNTAEGFAAPELVYKLIDRTRVDLDSETGQWTGVREAVEKLAKEYPSLLKQATRGAGSVPREESGNPSRRSARNGNGGAAHQGSGDPFVDYAAEKVSYEPL